MDAAAIQQVRSFNRVVAESIGALDDRFLGRGRPIGESRLLWEIGQEGVDIRDLRRRLDLDSGYVSRVLHSLARQGLVRVCVSSGDARVRRAQLTTRGVAERKELDRRSDALAAGILDSLNEAQRTALVAAMRDVERLLGTAMVRIAVEDPASPDARWCLEQYFAELDTRFSTGFDPARGLPADAHELTPPAGAFMIARVRGRAVGCGALKLHGREPAELRRMWVDQSARGMGLGARLLRELEHYAHASGAAVVRLETNRALREAIALYRRSGYVEVDRFSDEPYAHHWFEKRLTAPYAKTRRARGRSAATRAVE
jgi:DNA-binding MarR family transcriptional regulator/GNAT superfamily N-acetyltransferase